MLDLRSMVNGLVSQVNPKQPATLRMSIGYTTAADGTRKPTYDDSNPLDVLVRVQSLANNELQHLDGLNIQAVTSGVYIDGAHWEGCVRPDIRGGDLLTINGQDWLIVVVLESWGDDNSVSWTKAAITRQN